MNVKEKLQALLTASNNTTGETDTTLTDAVQRLVDGFGGGGVLPEWIENFYSYSFTPASDTQDDIVVDWSQLEFTPNCIIVASNQKTTSLMTYIGTSAFLMYPSTVNTSFIGENVYIRTTSGITYSPNLIAGVDNDTLTIEMPSYGSYGKAFQRSGTKYTVVIIRIKEVWE